MSEHFSRSTCPVRQSSVTIWRALWHKVMLSSVRKLMSLLLSHCTPEEPGGRFIWAALFMRRRVQAVRGRRRGGALRPDPYPVRTDGRLTGRARCVVITGSEVLLSNSDARRSSVLSIGWSGNGITCSSNEEGEWPCSSFNTCRFYRLLCFEASTGFFFFLPLWCWGAQYKPIN